jgi:CheY-like chemotaxis protein
MNGRELNTKMKTDPKLAEIPVVVVSCAVDASAPLKGVQQYLPKPLRTSRLLDLAERYCS